MSYKGDFALGATVYIPLTTNAGSGGAVAPSSSFEVEDFRIYKNGSATQKATTNGITIASPFDSVVGLHALAIDTSNATGDAGFWSDGGEYAVVAVPDETVDGETVVSVVAEFSIGRALAASRLAAIATAILATPANKLVTNPSGQVVASNFVSAPSAADNATAVVERVVDGTEGAGAVGTILHAISTMIEFVSGVWRWKGSSLSEVPSSVGSGQYQITLVADSLAGQVPGTKFGIVGTVLNVTTGSDGEALINLDAGTYTLRTTPPAGYETVADQPLVVAADATVAVTLVAIGYDPAIAPGCNVTIPVRSQFTEALEGVQVRIKFIGWETGATKPATILSPPPVVLTDASGLVSVVLYRLARYQATYAVTGDTTKVVPFTVPDAGTYTVIEP